MTMPSPYRAVPILVVEDDQEDTRSFRLAADSARLANRIAYVHAGEEAWSWVQGSGEHADRGRFPAPGLVFLDRDLPDLDGLELLERLRGASLPVVVMSSHVSDEDVLRAYELDCLVYIQKPITAENLTAVILGADQFDIQLVERTE